MDKLMWINDKKIMESQLRQLYADIVWGHKTQEHQANLYLKMANHLELTKILMSTLTTSGLVGLIFINQNRLLEIITTVISMVALFVNTYTKTYNFNALYKEYKTKSLEFLDIRNRTLSLLYSLRVESISMDEIVIERNNIEKEIKKIHMNTKEVSTKTIKFVSKSLNMNNDNIYNEDEIDEIVPSILKLGRKKYLKEIE